MNNILVYVFVAINILSFILMGYDKRTSIKNRQRVPEAGFMILTLFGGIIGVVLSALMFNHKVSKRSFHFKILLMFMIFIIILYVYFSKGNMYGY